ncbi:hypothetical protein OHA72_38130 [Dactylosporangium sp. NBC_01737]|uniref:hypothetical protein n=1 Tax=Dactylosporangium sp. NBC_01737 TaxID=2975959 RepID=UPI002E116CB0|nr:hypothetical protein OHA72_38130 [Dactylosporangium sp. NBC_01737]
MTVRPTLSAAVMAHPRRTAAVARLREQVPGLTVAMDPRPDGPPTSVRSAAVAWASADPGATHHLVLEDDALPCADLLDGCAALIRGFPSAAVSLFVNDSARTAALTRMAVWSGRDAAQVIDIYVPTQGLILPAGAASGLAAFLRAHDDLTEAGDIAVLRYLHGAGVPVVVAVPNLVDHDDLTSIMGNTDHGRRGSVCYPGHAPHGDAGRLFDTPEIIPYLSESTTCSFLTSTPASAAPLRSRTADMLHLLGTDHDALRAQAPAAPAGLPAAAVHELWLTAYATGMLLTGSGRADPGEVRRHADTPAGRAAAASMASGGLGRGVPAPLLAAAAGPLADVVLHGLDLGSDAGSLRGWPGTAELTPART